MINMGNYVLHPIGLRNTPYICSVKYSYNAFFGKLSANSHLYVLNGVLIFGSVIANNLNQWGYCAQFSGAVARIKEPQIFCGAKGLHT